MNHQSLRRATVTSSWLASLLPDEAFLYLPPLATLITVAVLHSVYYLIMATGRYGIDKDGGEEPPKSMKGEPARPCPCPNSTALRSVEEG
jgi:hypothetical protein